MCCESRRNARAYNDGMSDLQRPVLEALDALGVSYDLYTHPPVFTAEDAVEFIVIEGEYQVVAVGEAKFDAVGRVEFLPGNTQSVDEDAVAAAEILDVIFAGFREDAGVLPRGAVVTQHQMILGLTTNGERCRMDGNAGSSTGRCGDDQSGWPRRCH